MKNLQKFCEKLRVRNMFYKCIFLILMRKNSLDREVESNWNYRRIICREVFKRKNTVKTVFYEKTDQSAITANVHRSSCAIRARRKISFLLNCIFVAKAPMDEARNTSKRKNLHTIKNATKLFVYDGFSLRFF